MPRSWIPVALVLTAVAGAWAPAALAAPTPQPFKKGQFGRFWHIIPPGQKGGTTGLQAAQFLSIGTRPPHADDQRDIYTKLIAATPGLADDKIGSLFPDADFGIAPGRVEFTDTPREDVTIQRDSWGRPHITGSTRSGTMFGAGYASAQDSLVFMDVLRHLGAGQLTWAGGANVSSDEATWLSAPYTAADRQAMVDQIPAQFGADGAQVIRDLQDYSDGVNAHIARVQTNPTEMPGEYALLGHPEGPQAWSPTDTLSVATLIGGELGKGGGAELQELERLQTLIDRFGRTKGYRLWRDLREVDDPEAPTTANSRRGFPYSLVPRTLTKGVALPDKGSLRFVSPVVGRPATRRAPAVRGNPLLRFPTTDSNALLLSAKRSATGHPLAAFGSQAGYFEPEIWQYQDLHGPGIDVAGANIPGTGPYVEIGHGPDYAWSATSAGQDIIDIYAVDLCKPDGSAPDAGATSYVFRGKCTAMEPIDQHISWTQSAGDPTPSGQEDLRTYRTKIGLVVARATIGGKPVAYTKLRSTYRHEFDSAMAFFDWNQPDRIPNAQAFQRSAFKLGYTFNWLYADNRDIAYINTGANPLRPKGTNGVLPQRYTQGAEWKDLDTDRYTQAHQPYRERPQAVNEPYLVSWNNKQARHCCGNGPYGPVFRSQSLTDAIDRGLKQHGGKLTLGQLVDAAEFGGVADLRGLKLLPWALKILGTPSAGTEAEAVTKLRAWIAAGAPRADRNGDGHYDHADAVRITDVWLRLLPKAIFEPVLGEAAFKAYDEDLGKPDEPNSFHGQKHAHLGSAWENGWFHLIAKDLRTVLGKRGHVVQRWSRKFCGIGSLKSCRTVLASTLAEAVKADPAKLYEDPTVSGKCGTMDPQMCFDSLAFRAIGALTQPNIPWQNRPTQQQVLEVTGHR